MDNTTTNKNEPTVAGNASISMLANIFYLLTRLILPPLIVGHLTLSEYGLWSACFILIMYIGLADAGFSKVYVRFTARFYAQNDVPAINRLLSTGIASLTAISILLLSVVWFALPLILRYLHVLPEHIHTAKTLIMSVTAMYMLDMTLGAYCYLLHGLQRIREEKKIAMIGYIAEPILIAIFLYAGFGIYSLLFAFVLRYCWSLSSFIRLAHHFLPGLKIRLQYFDTQMMQLFLNFGVKVQICTLLGTFLFSIDRVLVGFLMGTKGIALLELGTKIPVSALTIPSTISNVTFPAAARHLANDDHDAVHQLYLQSTRAVAICAAFPLAFMVTMSFPLGVAWLGHKEELSLFPTIMSLTALWCHLHITTGPGTAVFRAMGIVSNEFLYHGLRLGGILLVLSACLLIGGVHIQSFVFGIAGGNALASTTYMVLNQRKLGLPLKLIPTYVWMPVIPAYISAALIHWCWTFIFPDIMSRMETLLMIGLFGMLYCVLTFLMLWPFLQSQEKNWLKEKYSRFQVMLPTRRKV